MLGFLAFIPKSVWLGLAAAALATGLYFAVLHRGVMQERQAEAVAVGKATAKAIQTKETVKLKIMRLDDAALDERLSHWMRD